MDDKGAAPRTLPSPLTVAEMAARRRGAQWAHASVGDVMSHPVLTIDVSESLWDAWQLLSVSGLRHLAATEHGRCLGVVSDRLILTDIPVSEPRLRARRVGDLLGRTKVRSLLPDDPLADAARMMSRHSTEAVPVLDIAQRLVGIVTGSDLVRWWADDRSARP